MMESGEHKCGIIVGADKDSELLEGRGCICHCKSKTLDIFPLERILFYKRFCGSNDPIPQENVLGFQIFHIFTSLY